VICRKPFRPRARRVTLVLMDVDGVLTDGSLPFTARGPAGRVFDVKDGAGIAIAHRFGLRTGLLSGRGGGDALARARGLGIREIHLEARDKITVCYIGDDILDLAVLRRVGLPVAPADAHPEVRRRVPFITGAAGGRGAVREVIDGILRARGLWGDVMRQIGGIAP
jgi:3-deoxy-D-manno-octulosonate 8-phosphate phosphatase (KDO 8-P phosphatase)